jgi:hypothetical protein
MAWFNRASANNGSRSRVQCAVALERLAPRRRDKAQLVARTALAQYRRWQHEFDANMVLMQVGAFVEQL